MELSAPKRLGRTVVLGYCDIASAGIRALEGLSPPSGPKATGMRETGRECLTFSGMGSAAFDGSPPLEAVHFDSDGGADSDGSVTLLKLNTVVGQDLSASLAMSVVDLLAAHQPALERVIIAAAVQPPKRHQMPKAAPAPFSTTPTASTVVPQDVVFAFSCGSQQLCDTDASVAEGVTNPLSTLVSSLAVLPSGARIADSFLATFARLCQLEDLPLLVLVRHGYRATGAAADADGTDEAINALGDCLAKVLDLEFSTRKACAARKSRGWKGTDPERGVVPGYI